MSRAERLIELVQALRRRRAPATGAALADELGVSLRTLYRDIDSLRAQGAPIDGEAGLGFVLRPGFLLPPLMFSVAEIEALALGCRWVAHRGDTDLAAAAHDALAKIAAVLPPALAGEIEDADDARLIVPPAEIPETLIDAALVRDALRTQSKLLLRYSDGAGSDSERIVWPLAIGYFQHVLVLVAWCEMRDGFRHFRLDRIRTLARLGQRYPGRRRELLRQWRNEEVGG